MSKNSSWELAEGMGKEYLGLISQDVNLWNQNSRFLEGLEAQGTANRKVARLAVYKTVSALLEQGSVDSIDEASRSMNVEAAHSIVTDALYAEASHKLKALSGDGTEFDLGKYKATVWVHEPGVVAVTRYGDPYHGFLRWTKRREVEPGEVFEARGHQFISRPEVGGRLHLARNFGETILSRLVNPATAEPNVALNIYQKN